MAPPHHPHHPPRHPPPHRPRLPASQVLAFVDDAALDGALAPLVPDAGDRAFISRCLVGEGPLHHRGANYILLSLLSQVLAQRGGGPLGTAGAAVPMRLPPHLATAVDESSYPVRLPLEALRRLAGDHPERVDAMVDCLTDGPPQHTLANVLMVTLMDALLAEERR